MIKKILSIFKSKKKVNKQDRRLVYRLISESIIVKWNDDTSVRDTISYLSINNFPIDLDIDFKLASATEVIKEFVSRVLLCAEIYNEQDAKQKIDRFSIRIIYSEKTETTFIAEFLDAKGKNLCFMMQIKKDIESFNRYECESTILVAPNRVHSEKLASMFLKSVKMFLPIKVEHDMFLSNDIAKDFQELLGDYYNKFSLQVVSSQSYTSPLLNKKERNYVKVFGNLSKRIIQNQTKKQTSLQTTP